MRYKITLSYDGSAFSGWQIQKNAPSVQGALEDALVTLLGRDSGFSGITGAGRTDTGVNARNYVAHFDCDSDFDPEQIRYKLNAILPREIAIHHLCATSSDFHARYGAKMREYQYFISSAKDPFLRHYSWYCRYPLDIERMNRACALLPGVHDCSCFEKTGSSNATSICEIFYAGWDFVDGQYVFTIRANRFLRNMVRAIVGTMVDIGRGAHEPEYLLELFASGNRSDAGQSVPGHALFLTKVEY